MAGKRHTMRVDARANQITAKCLREGALEVESKKASILLLCKTVAQFMEELHGGEWRIQISHDVGLVCVVRRLNRDKPEPRIEASALREAL